MMLFDESWKLIRRSQDRKAFQKDVVHLLTLKRSIISDRTISKTTCTVANLRAHLGFRPLFGPSLSLEKGAPIVGIGVICLLSKCLPLSALLRYPSTP
ncbi:hypothetical protein QR680_013664 [Steinernema hermaphroditum]|uniref:Uncharacterized protein n=1 Tax=Steinernema hermaphroditum TaxID=289476 RepID=A0AA39I8V4_9BILA|nr:hypothetical protein QR680_013664 [Steinernema hermaphroditum]